MASKGQGLVEQIDRDTLQEIGNRVIKKIGRLPMENAKASYFVRDNYKENENYTLRCQFKTRLYQNPNPDEVEEARMCQLLIFFKKGTNEFNISSIRLDDVQMNVTVLDFNPNEDIKVVDPTLRGYNPKGMIISAVLQNFLRNRSLDYVPMIDLWENNIYKRKLKSRTRGATAPRISCTSEGYSFTLIS